MFTGIKPFTDEETRAVSAKILKDDVLSPRRVNRDIPRSIQRVIKKCLRKKPQRRYGSLLEVETKLGNRLAGRTTKAASLLRISDYLVSREVFEAAPEQETMIITGKPRASARLRNAVAAGSMLLLLGAGAGAYHYYRTLQDRNVVQHPPAVPVTASPLVTRPQVSTAPASTVTAVPAGTPAIKALPLSSPDITTRPAQTAPPASIGQKQMQTTPARKKSSPPKKKKKKTVPVS